MVSGAAHTTGDTIRPAFEIIKAARGRLRRLERLLHVPRRPRARLRRLRRQPEAGRRSSSRTSRSARPRRPPASASSRGSRCSPTRPASRAAARTSTPCARRPRRVRERRPDLKVEGPIQYDAAVDATVAKLKLPESEVAGHGDRLHLPRPRHRERRLQGRAALGARRGDRTGAAGPAQAGERPQPRLHGHRHRQHGRDHGDPGAEQRLRLARTRPSRRRACLGAATVLRAGHVRPLHSFPRRVSALGGPH